jgi:hypothetical protein
MADDWYKAVAGHQRVSHLDGHAVNESYKVPSATGKTNTSYAHPQVKPTSFQTAWKTADSALGEGHRPSEQLGRSKTVFPVTQEKTPGVPRPPSYAKPSRAASHSPAPTGIIAGPAKPTTI